MRGIVITIIFLIIAFGSTDVFAKKFDERIYKERMGILNAYFVPEKTQHLLYNSITPVNTFRLIFNELFSANFELLEERIYFSDSITVGEKRQFNFIDVTDQTK